MSELHISLLYLTLTCEEFDDESSLPLAFLKGSSAFTFTSSTVEKIWKQNEVGYRKFQTLATCLCKHNEVGWLLYEKHCSFRACLFVLHCVSLHCVCSKSLFVPSLLRVSAIS